MNEGRGRRKEKGEGERGSNCLKGITLFIPGVPEVGQPKERYHSTG